MRLAVSHRRAVEDCYARPRRRSEGQSADSGADSEEAEIVDAVIGTGKVVDTDDEASAGSLGSSSSSGDDPFIDKYIIAKPLKPESEAIIGAAGSSATTEGATKARRSGLEPLWQDPYFTLWTHPKVDFVKMMIREVWRQPAPEGMGTTSLTKNLAPRHYDEGVDDPVRSVLLMRA